MRVLHNYEKVYQKVTNDITVGFGAGVAVGRAEILLLGGWNRGWCGGVVNVGQERCGGIPSVFSWLFPDVFGLFSFRTLGRRRLHMN